MKNKYLIFLLVVFIYSSCSQKHSEKMREKKIDNILSQMTLEEKIDMIGGYESFNIRPLERLGIPEIRMADGPVGVRNYGKSTAYPASVCLAASWDVDLARKVGQSIAREAKTKNVQIMLGPGMNIYRGPWCGRNFEYLGEDPFLAGEIASSYIKGMQGEGVMATAKHYTANFQDYNRHNVSSDMDERTLREIYLPAFKACVTKGNVAAVMTAYNLVNGVHCSQNDHLINEILKSDWNFDGIVMSDWTSTYDAVGAANAGLDLEMPYGKYMNRDSLIPAVKEGIVAELVIDDKVRRILRKMMEFGFFDNPEIAKDSNVDLKECNSVALEAARGGIVLLKNEEILPVDRTKIKTIAILGPNADPAVTGGGGSSKVEPLESVSLYKGIKKIAGDNVEVLYSPGPFTQIPENYYRESESFYCKNKGVKADGLKFEGFDNIDLEGDPIISGMDKRIDLDMDKLQDKGLPSQSFSVRWTGNIMVNETGDYRFVVSGDDGYRLYINDSLVMDEWKNQPERTTIVIRPLTGGKEYNIKLEYYQDGGDAAVRFGYKKYAKGLEKEALDFAAKADVVVVALGFNDTFEGEGSDREFELHDAQVRFLKKVLEKNANTIVVLNSGGNVDMQSWLPQVKALLHAWYPGQAGGQAIAEIIFGDVNPSGKLPMSFEKRWEDNPTYDSYHDDDGDLKVYFNEGVFLGYRYYDSKNVEPQFPFGFGLSYTTFGYSNLKLDKRTMNKDETLKIKVDITNTGKRAGGEVVQLYIGDEKASVPRPEKELKAFDKVFLQPGEKKTVTLEINKVALSYYSTEKNAWVAEPGTFEVLVGSSSRDIRLKDTFVLK
jgi:beta-glucosidase